MSERFFSTRAISGDRVVLDGPEAHHLLHVMRAGVGQEVTVFDGSGAEFRAVVETPRRAQVELRVIERREIDRELPFPLIVAVALPKGERQKWLVEKLTELGVTKLVPLVTERSVAQPSRNANERLRRSVIEAAKQCCRNRLMEIAIPQTWSEWLATDAAAANANALSKTRRLVAHPSGAALATLDVHQPAATYLAIGPEGGLTDSEVAAAAAAAWQIVALGPRILRVETAAVALASVIVLR